MIFCLVLFYENFALFQNKKGTLKVVFRKDADIAFLKQGEYYDLKYFFN